MRTFFTVILLSLPWASAQLDVPPLPDIPPVIGGIVGSAQGVCDFATGIDFVPGEVSKYICMAAELATKSEQTLKDFHETFTGLGQQLVNDWLGEAISSIGGGLDEATVTKALNDLGGAMAQGPEEFRQVLRNRLSGLRKTARQQDNPPPGSASYWYKRATTEHPNLALARASSEVFESKVIETNGEAMAVQEADRVISEQIATSEAMGHLMNQVLAPGNGDAARIRSAGRTAVSTRAAIIDLIDGVTTTMEQSVVASGHMSEQAKLAAQQRTMTNWQIKLLNDQIAGQTQRQLAEEKSILEAAFGNITDMSTEYTGQLMMLSDAMADILASNPRDLDLEAVGWKEVN